MPFWRIRIIRRTKRTPQQEALREEARRDLTARVAQWAAQMGVSYGRVAIRFQKSRWGSCSSKGNINLNAVLMFCPAEVRDYVVIHELAHRREMNHSPRFWAIVEKYCPTYRACRKYLRDNGASIIKQIL